MSRKSRLRTPESLRDRPPIDREEFLGIYFDAGRERDAARRLWIAFNDHLHIDLSGLHPDDELKDILRVAWDGDSLRKVETTMLLEELLGHSTDEDPSPVFRESFRELVRRLASRADSRRV